MMLRQPPINKQIFVSAGAAIPTRGKNNGATTTISFLCFIRAISTKGAPCLRLLAAVWRAEVESPNAGKLYVDARQ